MLARDDINIWQGLPPPESFLTSFIRIRWDTDGAHDIAPEDSYQGKEFKTRIRLEREGEKGKDQENPHIYFSYLLETKGGKVETTQQIRIVNP